MTRIENTRPWRRNGIIAALGVLAVTLCCMGGQAQTSAQFAALQRLGLAPNSAQPNGVEATNTSLALPGGVAFDAAGDLFIADTNHHVVLEVGLSGIVNIAAGNGEQGFGGDGGAAASALLDSPAGIAVDASGNLYIADSHNNRVREVSSGVITTLAGSGAAGYAGDGGPATAAVLDRPTSVAVDSSGNVYIADTDNHRIRKIAGSIITTVAGNGAQVYSGDGGAATSAGLDSPSGIAVDAAFNLYIGDTHNQRVRAVNFSTGIISTLAGTGPKAFTGDGIATAVALARPRGVAVDSTGTVYVADSDNNRVRAISGGAIVTLAGNGSQGVAANAGAATGASLNTPGDVALFGNVVAIADTSSPQVLEVTQSGEVFPVAGQPPAGTELLAIAGPVTVVYGSGQLTATFKNGSNAATGSIIFYDGVQSTPVVIGTVSIAGNTAVLNTSGLAAGTHLILASYQGDVQNPAVSSGAYVLVVTAAPLTAVATNVSILYGQAVPQLAGTVSGVLQQDSGNVTATFTTAATGTSPVGVYPVTATISGPAAGNYALVSSSGSVSIAQAPTATTLTGINGTQPSVTATVVSTTSGSPTGTVNFFEGANLLNLVPVTISGGTATLPVGTLPSGSHTINAVYSGDGNFLSSTSNSVVEIVAAPLGFAIASTPASQTLSRGGTVSYSLTLTPVNPTFVFPVSLSVLGLPSGVTATFAPASFAAGGAASTSVVTLSWSNVGELRSRDANSLGTSTALAVMLFPLTLFRRSRWKASWLSRVVKIAIVPALILAALGTLSGCGVRRSSETYAVTVVAVSGTVSHTTVLSLTLK